MDVLIDKQTRTYDALSRYSAIPFYYNTQDNKYVCGITRQLSTTTNYTIHKVQPYDTFDTLSLYYYGRPDYYWVIADFNQIQDSLAKLYGNYSTLKIPTISYITYGR